MTTVLLDPEDPTPPYQQLRRQLLDQIAGGRLAPGDRLPPVRQLAGDLGLAAGTVARVYRELEVEGVLSTRRGAGTRVAESAADHIDRHALLAHAVQVLLARTGALGFSREEVLDAVQDHPR